MSITVMYDAIHANVGALPKGAQSAGYTTGSPDIKWTAADWTIHPVAVRICQDSGASDVTADILDVETGAATNGEAARWYRQAADSFTAAHRPGQRSPSIYTSASNVTQLVNALLKDGVTKGPGLWVANWNLTQAEAAAEVAKAAGPYPIIGVQFHSAAQFDISVMSSTWLGHVSHAAATAGPHRHVTTGAQTFGDLANSRHSTLQGFMSRAFTGYTPADWQSLEAVSVGKGYIFYTERP